jgi:hypothetical protein
VIDELLVYNLTVDRDHTYFVGAAGVLGHNAGGCKIPQINWNKVLHGEFKKGKFRGFHHSPAGIVPPGRVVEDVKMGPGGFYTAKVGAINGAGNLKYKAQRSTFFPDAWSETKVRAAINSVLIETKGRGGMVAVRDIVQENVPGVYIKVQVQNGNVIQAFPVIK